MQKKKKKKKKKKKAGRQLEGWARPGGRWGCEDVYVNLKCEEGWFREGER